MATYEYKCDKEHIYTEVRGMTEDQKVTECPKCGGELRRIFYSAPVQFKGRGFYKTGG
jgi:putative FmdB family regulatory protein